MQIDLDSITVFVNQAGSMHKAFMTSLDVQLLNLGLDPTTIIVRGPTLVLMGFVLSILTYQFKSLFGGNLRDDGAN